MDHKMSLYQATQAFIDLGLSDNDVIVQLKRASMLNNNENFVWRQNNAVKVIQTANNQVFVSNSDESNGLTQLNKAQVELATSHQATQDLYTALPQA